MASAGSGQLTKLKVATLHITADAGLFIAQEKGYFKQQGLEVEFVSFSTAGDTIAPLSAGQIDVGSGAISAGLFNAVARGLDIKIVADKGQHKPVSAGFSSSLSFVISKKAAADGAFKGLKDLKGKVVAMTSTGSGTEITVDKALQKAGLTLKDITIKPMPFPDMLPALANGSIDVANEIEPFVAEAQAKGIGVPWMKSEDVYPGQQGGVVMFGPSITKLGPDVGTRFMVAYVKGLRDYNDAFGPKRKDYDGVVDIFTKNTKVKDKALYAKMGWDYLDPNGEFNEKAIADDLDWYVAHGYTKQKPDMAKIADDHFVKDAVKELGPYKPA